MLYAGVAQVLQHIGRLVALQRLTIRVSRLDAFGTASRRSRQRKGDDNGGYDGETFVVQGYEDVSEVNLDEGAVSVSVGTAEPQRCWKQSRWAARA